MTRRLRIRVFGRVQGVYFRATARDEARRLGLTGFARNEPDGSVLIEVEGDDQAIPQFLAWCHQGPPAARVTSVETEELPVSGYAGFIVD